MNTDYQKIKSVLLTIGVLIIPIVPIGVGAYNLLLHEFGFLVIDYTRYSGIDSPPRDKGEIYSHGFFMIVLVTFASCFAISFILLLIGFLVGLLEHVSRIIRMMSLIFLFGILFFGVPAVFKISEFVFDIAHTPLRESRAK